jgi:hypothetical protein
LQREESVHQVVLGIGQVVDGVSHGLGWWRW